MSRALRTSGVRLPESMRISQQSIDPLGALAAWPLAPISAVAITAFAILTTLLHGDQVSNPLPAVVAVVLCAASGVVHVVNARPDHGRYGSGAFLLVIGLMTCAMIAQVAGTWGSNRMLQDDFGHIAVGIMLAAAAPYRPAVHIVVVTACVSLIAGLLAAVQDPYFAVIHVPVIERAVVGVVPVLGLGLASAAYANQLVKAVMEWQRGVASSDAALEGVVYDGLARTIQQEQLAALSDEVLPFLAGVAASGAVTADDVERSRRLARAVRGSLVAELNHSWLEQLRFHVPRTAEHVPSAVQGAAQHFAPPLLTVHDGRRRAFRMAGAQRTALAALLSELSTNARIGASDVTIWLEPDAARPTTRTHARIDIELSGQETRVRTMLRPYLNVLHLAFANVAYTMGAGVLSVKFSYDHEPSGERPGAHAWRQPADSGGDPRRP